MSSSSPQHRSNLVAPPDQLVGRDELTARILAAIDEGARLITLTGTAGIGKSRLGAHIALSLRSGDDCPEAWRVDCSTCRDLAALWDAACAALQVPGGLPDAPVRIGQAMAARGRSVVFLDDFDDLAVIAAQTVSSWSLAAPEACWLITSRQRLNVPGELVFELPPLGLDAGPSPGALGDAARLLVDLAGRRGTEIPQEDLSQVQALARELDGIPLAIQLAAARLSVMGPRVLLHRLRANRSILERSGRAPGSRHASLEAALEGSWNALLPHEREALAQCTVFRGSFDLDAAEAVLDLSSLSSPPPVVDVLQALRDKSMIRALPGGPGGPGVRLVLYRSIHAFAAARVAPDVARALEARHADHYVSLGESDPDILRRRGRLLLERDNLLAIVERILGQGPVTARRAEPALRALLLLSPGVVASRPLHALLRSIDPMIEVTRDSGADPLLYASVLALRGALRRASDRTSATRDLVRALGMARTLGAGPVEALCLSELGRVLFDVGDTDEARRHFERALELYRTAGSLAEEAGSLTSLAMLETASERLDEAGALFGRAVAIYESLGDLPGAVPAMRWLASVLLDRNDEQGAARWLTRATAAAQDAADRPEWARCTIVSGLLEQDSGKLERAGDAYRAALSALRELGEAGEESLALGCLGILRSQCGNHGEAYALLRAACVAPGCADILTNGLFQAHLAWLDRLAGRHDDARAGFEAARDISVRRQCTWLGGVVRALELGTGVQARSVHARIAGRLAASSPGAAAEPPPDHALVVGPKASWLRLPGARTLDLERRRPLARIIVRLARERTAPAPQALGWEELLAAGWPGEKVLPTAGAHRVRVAVSTLRKLGLGELLKTSEHGYELDPSTPVVVLAPA